MKVLIVSTLYSGGGAEIQSEYEFDYLRKKGIEVKYITFDPNLKSGESLKEDHVNLYGEYSISCRRAADLFRNIFLERRLSKYVDSFNPDIVHLHQVTFAFDSICRVLKEYPVIQTIHDYSIICDKGTCILNDYTPCTLRGYKYCLKKCYSVNLKSQLKYLFRSIARYKSEKVRRKDIDLLISPSACLKNYLIKNGYHAICINNSINITDFDNFTKHIQTDKKIVLYYGAVRKSKGVLNLIEAYSPNEVPNIELHIIGGFDKGRKEDSYSEDYFMKIIQEKGIVFHGRQTHEAVIRFLQSTYAVMIPSLWLENYPTTAIEGIYGKCVVCGSNRGGVPELIADEKLIFDVMNENEIKECFLKIDNMSTNDYRDVCEKQLEMFLQNNEPEVFFGKLFKVFDEVIDRYEIKSKCN